MCPVLVYLTRPVRRLIVETGKPNPAGSQTDFSAMRNLWAGRSWFSGISRRRRGYKNTHDKNDQNSSQHMLPCIVSFDFSLGQSPFYLSYCLAMSSILCEVFTADHIVPQTNLNSPGPFVNASMFHFQLVLTQLIINANEALKTIMAQFNCIYHQSMSLKYWFKIYFYQY